MTQQTTLPELGRLTVTDAQIVCAAGTEPTQVLADVLNEFSYAREQAGWFTTVNVQDAAAIIAADIDGISSTDPNQRLLEMLLVWLAQVTWPAQPPTHVYVLAPVDLTDWLKLNTSFTNAHWHWSASLTDCMTQWNTTLAHSSAPAKGPAAESTLWLALDSRIQPEAWYDQRDNLYHEHNSQGRMVGEGLAAIWLAETGAENNLPVILSEEPKALLAAEDTTHALKTMVDQAPPSTLAQLLTNHDHRILHACEMHFFTSQMQGFIPKESPPEDIDEPVSKQYYFHPPAIEPPIADAPVSLATSLGDLGLATLPMQLALLHFSQQVPWLNKPWQGAITFVHSTRIYWPVRSPSQSQSVIKEANP